MRTPDFFIIGAQKCGTTSLAAWLGAHPAVFMCPGKEPWYFAGDIRHEGVQEWEEYLQLFSGAGPRHLRCGEASVSYLPSRTAVPSIEARLPGSRYIVMLRDPVEMVRSLHGQLLRNFYEDEPDLETAWRLCARRRRGERVPAECPDPLLLDYAYQCSLGSHLERLYRIVPRERVLVLLLDDLRRDPRREYLRVLEFLGLPDDGRAGFPVHNEAGRWRLRLLALAVRRARLAAARIRGRLGVRGLGLGWALRLHERFNRRTERRAEWSPAFRHELEAHFRDEVQLLSELLRRDLTPWLEGRRVPAPGRGAAG